MRTEFADVAYYVIDRRGSHGVHQVDCELEDEDDDEKGRHFEESCNSLTLGP